MPNLNSKHKVRIGVSGKDWQGWVDVFNNIYWSSDDWEIESLKNHTSEAYKNDDNYSEWKDPSCECIVL
jgi:hypothetical protein